MPGTHRAPQRHRALDEEVQLGEVVGPGHIGRLGVRLRTGGVEYQHIDGAEPVGDRGYQPGDLPSSVTSAGKTSAIPPSARMRRATSSACPSPASPLTATASPSSARRSRWRRQGPASCPSQERHARGPQRRDRGPRTCARSFHSAPTEPGGDSMEPGGDMRGPGGDVTGPGPPPGAGGRSAARRRQSQRRRRTR